MKWSSTSAGLTNGLTKEETVEVLLQSAVYVGVPASNTALAVANQVLGEGSIGSSH